MSADSRLLEVGESARLPLIHAVAVLVFLVVIFWLAKVVVWRERRGRARG